ncbi:MAG: hypothetical protein E5X43_28130, partial [Mesorhizobium sp.]
MQLRHGVGRLPPAPGPALTSFSPVRDLLAQGSAKDHMGGGAEFILAINLLVAGLLAAAFMTISFK